MACHLDVVALYTWIIPPPVCLPGCIGEIIWYIHTTMVIYLYILHEIICIGAKIIQCLIVHSSIQSTLQAKYQYNRSMGSMKTPTYLLTSFTAPRPGFALGFFFPLALSRCSFCFSFASVVSPLAALRTSMSLSGSASARTCCSTKDA